MKIETVRVADNINYYLYHARLIKTLDSVIHRISSDYITKLCHAVTDLAAENAAMRDIIRTECAEKEIRYE